MLKQDAKQQGSIQRDFSLSRATRSHTFRPTHFQNLSKFSRHLDGPRTTPIISPVLGLLKNSLSFSFSLLAPGSFFGTHLFSGLRPNQFSTRRSFLFSSSTLTSKTTLSKKTPTKRKEAEKTVPTWTCFPTVIASMWRTLAVGLPFLLSFLRFRSLRFLTTSLKIFAHHRAIPFFPEEETNHVYC